MWNFRTVLLSSLLSLLVLGWGYSQEAAISGKMSSSMLGFIENKGQIVDQNGSPNKRVKFLYLGNGYNVHLNEGGFSYEVYDRERIYSGQGDNRDSSLLYHFQRVDVELLNAKPFSSIVSEKASETYINYYNAPEPVLGVKLFKKVTYLEVYDNIDLEFVVSEGDKPIEYNFIVRPGGDARQIRWRYKGAFGEHIDNGELVIQLAQGMLREHIPASFIKQNGQAVDVVYQDHGSGVYGFNVPDYDQTKTLVIDPVPSRVWGTYFGGSGGTPGDWFLGCDISPTGELYATGFTDAVTNIATSGAHQISLGGMADGVLVRFNLNGTLAWATYYGGNQDDRAFGVAISSTGNEIYVVGQTMSTNNIATLNTKSSTLAYSGFLARFNPSGTRSFGRYIGDPTTTGRDVRAVSVKLNGLAVIVGGTSDAVTLTLGPGPFCHTNGGGFIGHFGPTGGVAWISHFPGVLRDVASFGGTIYAVGSTTTTGLLNANPAEQPYRGTPAGYILALTLNEGSCVWGSYFGGLGTNELTGVTLCGTGSPYLFVLGTTSATDASSIAKTPGPPIHQNTSGGSDDMYMGTFSASTGSWIWGSYYGGSGIERGFKVYTHNNDVYGVGSTNSSSLATSNAFATSPASGYGAIAFKFNGGSFLRVWATYTPASGSWGLGRGLDVCSKDGYFYVVGSTTTSTGVSTSGTHQQTLVPVFDSQAQRFSECQGRSLAISNTPACPSPGSLGTATATLTGGVGPMTYLWSNGDATQTVTGLASGAYTVTVTDAEGCGPYIATTTITGAAPLVGTASSSAPSYCAGQTISLVFNDFGTSYTYSWSGPSSFNSTLQSPTRASATTLMGGTYNVTFTRGDGCIGTRSVNVTINSLPTPSISPTTIAICAGQSASLTASGGGTYNWSNSLGTAATVSPSPATSTTYTVTVTSAAGCVATASRLVTVNPLPTPSISPATIAICAGQSASLTASGGGTYNWSNSLGTAATVSPSPAATTAYTVTVTNAAGCTATASRTVTVNPNPSATASNTGPYCAGQTISLSATGGGTYNWSGPSSFGTTGSNPTRPSATTAMGGTYTVTVTSAAGCTATASTNVVVNPNPSATASNTGPYVVGNTIQLNSSGGGTYSWSGPATFSSTLQNPTRASATALMAGTYTVTVTNLGCSVVTTTVVTIDGASTADNTGPYCAGQTIQLNASGGVSYSWSGPGGFTATTANPTRTGATTLMSGVYTVTVTTASSATSTASTTVTVNANPTATANNGGPYVVGQTINLTATGGGTYSWTGPNSFTSTSATPNIPSATAANAGVYTVVVTNASGCTASASTTVNVDGAATASNTGPYCAGQTIQLNASGGISYSWSGPGGFTATTANPTRTSATTLMSGVYTVTVTTASSATSTASTTVTVNANPTATANNGGPYVVGQTINLTATGGGTYSWTGPNSFTSTSATPNIPSATAANAGVYTVVVTNASGCTASANTTVNIDGAGSASNGGPYCEGQTIALSATGGVTYAWSGPGGYTNTGASITRTGATTAMAGVYTVTVTTASSATSTASTTVVVNSNPVATATNTGPYIVGATIQLNATGGGTYVWSGPSGFSNTNQNPTIPSATAAMAGFYNVTVTNANGCTATASTLVNIDGAGSASNAGPYCTGQTIVLTATGGVGYSWTGPGGYTATGATATRPSATLAHAGVYTVTITTSGGATTTAATTVTVNSSPVITAGNTGPYCEGQNISLNVTAGNAYQWTGPASFSETSQNPIRLNANITMGGAYNVTVTGANGCSASATTNVVVNANPSAVATNTGPYIVGATIQLNATGGGTYAWSGPGGFTSTLQNPTRLSATTGMAGVYTVTVTSAAGCTATASTTVNIDGAGTASNGGPYCVGQTIALSATGGVAYDWSGPSGYTASGANPTRPSATTVMAGVYTVTITTSGGATVTANTTVVVNTPPVVSATNAGPYCVGADISLGVTAGNSYVWTGPSSFNSVDQNPIRTGANLAMAGTYNVTVTAANGCTASASTVVVINSNPTPSASNTGPYVVGNDIQLNASGGASYAWSGPAGFNSTAQNPLRPSATAAMAGTYVVTVANANGCTATASTVVVIDGAGTASNGGPYCAGQTIQLNATGGVSFSWSGPASFSSNSPSPMRSGATLAMAGTYTVTITTGSGVTTTAITTVVVNANPTPTASNTGPYIAGQTIVLAATGGTSYAWSGPNGFVSALQNPSIAGATTLMAGVYTVTVTDANGCTAIANTPVVVDGAGNANNGGPYCIGQTIQLTASGGASYLWSGPLGFNSTSQNPNRPNASAGMGGIYTVTITTSGGATTTASTTVVLNPSPTATATNTGPYIVGQTIQLNATGGTVFSWQGPGGFTSTLQNPSIPGATSLMAGFYSVTVTDVNGCTATANTSVSVDGAGNASNTGPYCAGQNIQLNASGGISYAWSGPSGFSSTDQNPLRTSSTTAMAGIYTVTITTGGGATVTASTNVVINAAPAITVSNGGPYCVNDNIQLNASGGTGYNWIGPASFTSIDQNPVRFNASTAMGGTYAVTVTNAFGCTASTTTNVVVNPQPSATASNTGPYIIGDPIQLNATGGGTYAWSGPNSFNSTLQSPNLGPSTAVMAGVYTVTVTFNGCTATASTTVILDGAPTASNAGPFCPGANIQLSAGGGVSYLWSGPGGYTSNQQNATRANASATMAGVYTVTVTTSGGATATASTTVVVHPQPTATANNAGPYCVGQTIQLTATGGVSYTWFGPGGYNTGTQNPTRINASLGMAGIYSVTVTDANNCTASNSTSVDVNENPVVSISPPTTYCINSTINLTASGGTTYNWTGPGGFTATVANPSRPNATTAMGGTYTVTVTNAGGCSAITSTTVNVNTTLVPNILPAAPTVCLGQSTTLTATGGATYVWSNGPASATNTVAPATNTTYSVTAVDANGCTGTSSVNVVVNANPIATISPATAAICSGNAITLTASGGTNYLWSDGLGVNPVQSVSPVSTQNYSVTVTDANGCTAATSRSVVVNTTPNVVINGPMSTCSAVPITLTETFNTGVTWLWSTGDNSASITVAPTANTTYSVTVTTPAGCTATGSRSVSVGSTVPTVVQNPTGPICSGETISLEVSGGTSYTWSTGASTALITVTPTTTVTAPSSAFVLYSVTASGGGCNGVATVTVTVNGKPAPSISPPNPASCAGAVVSLSAFCSGCATYEWIDDDGVLVTGASLDVQPQATRSYMVTATSTAGCVDTVSKVVEVTPSPTAIITGASSRCVGSPASFTASVAGGQPPYTYSWSYNGNGGTSSTFNVMPGLGSLPLSIIVGDINGCLSRDTLILDGLACGVSDLVIMPTSSTGIAGQFCENTVVNISLSNPPVGVLAYVWSNGATTSFITPMLTRDTSFSLTLTVNGDPFNSYTTGPIRVFQGHPRIVSVSRTELCSPTETSVITLDNTTGQPCSDCVTDILRNGLVVANLTGLPNTYIANSPGTYQARSACGWSAAVGIDLNQPQASISTSAAVICQGNTATLNVQSNCSACGYLWSTGATTASISVATSQNYQVTVTNQATGCTVSAAQGITVTTPLLDTVTYFSVGASQAAVPIDSLIRNVAPSSVALSSITFSGANINSIARTFNARAAGVGTHLIVSSVSTGGCTRTDTGYIQVLPAPEIRSLSSAYCRNSGVTGQVRRDTAANYAYGNTGGLIAIERNVMTTRYTDYNGQPIHFPISQNPNSNAEFFLFNPDLVNTGITSVWVVVEYRTNITRFDPFGAVIGTASYVNGTDSVLVAVTPNFTATIAPIALNYCREDNFVRIELSPEGGVFSVRQLDGQTPGNVTTFTASPSGVPGTSLVFLNTFTLHQNELTNTNYRLRYTYAPGGCFSEDSLDITVVMPADANFTTSSGQTQFCHNAASVNLIPNQGGGVFYINGLGEPSAIFTPDSVGVFDIRYSIANAIGCVTEYRDTFTVHALPSLSMQTTSGIPLVNDTAFCMYDNALSISASPMASMPQGVLTLTTRAGTQTVGNPFLFNPATVLGGLPITDTTRLVYTYTSPQGCVNTLERRVVVHPRPQVSLNGLSSLYCQDASVVVPLTVVQIGQTQGVGQLFSTAGTVNLNPLNFTYTPAVALALEQISYRFQDTVTGCRDTVRRNVEVVNNNAIANANPRFHPASNSNLPFRACFTGDTLRVIALANSPNVGTPPFFSSTRGGILRQNGDTAWIVPNLANAGGAIDSFRYVLAYTYTEPTVGCVATIRDTMEVFLLPRLDVTYWLPRPVPSRDTICAQPGDSVRIYVYDDRFPGTAPLVPALVTHSGPRVNGRFFYPDVVGMNHVTVSYTDQFGCRNTVTDTIEVLPNPRPFITGLSNNYCAGSPNPVFVALPASGTWSLNIDNLNTVPGNTGNVAADYLQTLSTGQTVLYLSGSPSGAQTINFGTINLSYTVVQDTANSNSCISHLSRTIRVDSLPQLALAALPPILCTNDVQGVVLSGLVNGQPDSLNIGRFYEVNQTVPSLLQGNLFRPNIASGQREIRYVYQDPASGCTDSLSQPVEVYEHPLVNILNLNSSYCEDAQIVTLQDNSTARVTPGLPASVGNAITSVSYATTGNPASLQALLPSFNASFDPAIAGRGLDTLIFTVEDAMGCVSVLSQTVRINGLPGNVSITIGDTSLCENQSLAVPAVGSPSSTASRFSAYDAAGILVDSFTGSTDAITLLPQPGRGYAAVGAYQLIYRYQDDNGCVNFDTVGFVVHPAPVAALEQINFCVGDSIQLESRAFLSAYFNQLDTIREWIWSYQGNTLSGTTDSTISLGSLSAGLAPARLTVVTAAGCTDFVDSLVYVYRKPEVQLLSQGGCVGDSIWFSADSLGLVPIFNGQTLDSISSVTWDFGDGSPIQAGQSQGTIVQPQGHAYLQNGQFRASVEIVNNGYCVGTDTVTVIVSPLASVFPTAYVEGFNTPNNGWFAAANDSLTQWRWGLANGSVIQSGNNHVWALNGGAPYTPLASAWLYSPCFDLSRSERPMIKLDYLAHLYSFDGVALEVYDTSTNPFTGSERGWISLGRRNEGVNWYNNNAAVFGLLNFKPLDANTALDAWTNTVSDWTTGRFRLDAYKGYEKLRLRLSFGSVDVPNQDGRGGFALDNVWIGERQRNVAVEHFTNPNFQSMEMINDQFYSNVLGPIYGQDVVLMEYHTDLSGTDSINLLNPADHNARTFFYGANDAETVVDGNAYQGLTNDLTMDYLERGMLLDPAFRITINNFNLINNRPEVEATIQAAKDMPADEYVVHILLTEDSVFSQGAWQRHVFRKFLPDHNALNLQRSFQAGDTLQYRQTWTISNPSAYNYFRMRAVVLVQNINTKEIYQVVTDRNFNYFDPTVDVTEIETPPTMFSLKLFPNPTSNYLNWELDGELEEAHQWGIYDLRGVLLQQGTAEAGTRQNTHWVGDLPAGMYILRMQGSRSGHFIQRQFIVKQY